MTYASLPKPIHEHKSLAGPVVNNQPVESIASSAGATPTVAIGVWSSNALALDRILAYQRDFWERAILFWDTLRQRAGDGRFDGAWLVQNFENLKPEAVWEKYANLFSHLDQERERFLEFERWWNGFYFLSREEMLAIVESLFIGNSLEQGGLRICPGCVVDLRRIHNPLVIFASYGDNITPPHQALGWIPAIYANTNYLKRAGQRIVYLINPHVGHLGIFVSSSVARLEHRAILDSLKKIEALAAGLYEMKIDNPTGNPDCGRDAYLVRFEEHRVEDLKFPENRPAFRRVAEVSSQVDALYSATLGKWVEATATPMSAQWLEWLHPMRVSRYAFATDFNPWLRTWTPIAASIDRDRHAVSDTNSLKIREIETFDAVRDFITRACELRDQGYEFWFEALYGRAVAAEPATVSPPSPAISEPACGRSI